MSNFIQPIYKVHEITNKDDNIGIGISTIVIHPDDSIKNIKMKMVIEYGKVFSLEELHLFAFKEVYLDPTQIYQTLSHHGKRQITANIIQTYLSNIKDDSGNQLLLKSEEKEFYDYDDILKLDLTEKTYLVGKPIGQKFVFSNEYPIISDPFLITEYDTLLENSRREVSTLSSNLLLETGPIFKNTIYVCLAKDVFEIADINDVSTEYTSKIYYPFLYKDNISSLEELDTNRSKLIVATKETLTPDIERSFENVNMFYNVYEKQKPSTKFSENTRLTGIKSLKVIIYPDFKIKIPYL